eukprot:3372204-Amphidinium_carterae.1
MGGNLTVLTKSSGSGHRPIAVGETLRRLGLGSVERARGLFILFGSGFIETGVVRTRSLLP